MTTDTSLTPARCKAIQKKIDQQLRQTLLQMLRMEFRQRRRQMANEYIESALRHFLDDHSIVESYMLHTSATDLCQSEDPEQDCGECVLPLDEALRAAESAVAAMGNVAELDRELVYAAALMYPAGIFMMAHPLAEFYRHPGWTLQQERDHCRWLAMERPLSCLRRCSDPEVAQKMRYLTEQLDPMAQEPQQWQALKQAVQQSLVRIHALW